MTLKNKIQTDFLSALKSRNIEVKNALSFLKSKIIEAEIASPGKIFSDDDVLNVINKMTKQRKQSIEAYRAGSREDLVQKETAELNVLERYIPSRPTENDIRLVVEKFISDTNMSLINYNAKIGRTVGEVTKHFKGLADPTIIKTIVIELVQND